MESILRQIYQDRTSDADTLGVILVERGASLDSTTDYFDAVLLILVSNQRPSWETKHYVFNGYKVALHMVNLKQIREWLINSSHRRIVDWLMNGKVVFDRNEFIKNYRKKMIDFPINERKKKMGVEFTKFIRRFTDGKALFQEKHFLDAYNYILHALHHLARLSVIEHGHYPELTVWQQVKQIEPKIHKLYQELVAGDESVEKKLELLLIANEFELTAKTKLGSAHLLALMEESDEPWTIEEIKNNIEIDEYSMDVSILLEYLVQKGFIDIVKMKTKGEEVYHRLYQANKTIK
ncbi:nucleotidyltransferase-like protein [Texcoconibacillus texcoconensis]|uniref:Nucleotidyltransferase-like domain-containing protein n=1 Tax=Texcoconibacillus texcoconensis TaxID=1095777 RepID=A0A840QU53_9BACI|nr:nucleotidyltransferase-like protein [Texcoconibacillus texcoconensis]MBB5175076.1 hypothetical protein [Texcoconibacillus texcoconensis]